MKNVFFFSFDTVGSFFPPLLLDEALDQNNDVSVFFVYCDAILPGCTIKMFKSPLICQECCMNRNLLFSKYKDKSNITFVPLSSFLIKTDRAPIEFPIFDSLEGLKSYTYKSVQVGLGVVSTFVSNTRNIDPEFNDITKEALNNLLTSAIMIVDGVLALSKIYSIDEVRVCNGRTVNERSVYETFRHLMVDVFVYELSCSVTPFNFRSVKYLNQLPFDISKTTFLIEDYWKQNFNENESNRFYINKRYGLFASDVSYIKNQNDGKLPEGWDVSKKNIVIFNSSEDEMFSIGGDYDKFKLFKNQIEGIKYICEILKNIEEYNVYLRVHPNLSNVDPQYLNEIQRLNDTYGINVIAPDSSISTYSLLDYCDKVVVFGSTIGIEANYWRKPVVLLAPADYMFLNVAYVPEKITDIRFLLLNDLEVKPLIGSLKYSNFLFTGRGELFKYIDFSSSARELLNKKILIPNYMNLFDLIVKGIFKILRMIFSSNYNKKLSIVKRMRKTG
jgi:hypothetical protein